MADGDAERAALQQQAACAGLTLVVVAVVLALACIAARAVEALAASSREVARLTGEATVRASEGLGARAAERLAEAVQGIRQVRARATMKFAPVHLLTRSAQLQGRLRRDESCAGRRARRAVTDELRLARFLAAK